MGTVRILHVLHAMNCAGTETLLMNLYRNIDKDKIQFDFAVCVQEMCDYDDEIKTLGGRLIHYPRYRGINHLFYRKWWDDFFKTHKEYSIVHGHIGSTAAIYLSLAKKNGCYTIAHSHATDSNIQNLKEKIYKLYAYPTRWIADFYMGCSSAALMDRYGKKVSKNPHISKVFFNAIDVDKFTYSEKMRKEVRKEFHIGESEIVLGTVGRITPQKNPYMILDIVSGLKESGMKFIFLWFGRGELEEDVARKIREKHLENNIIMAGVRKDINRVLQAMDIFIFPSVYEGLGMTCVEAQAADLKCFCSAAIPIEAKVTENYTALPIDNLDAWVENIREYIINDKKKRKNRSFEMKRAGYDITRQANWIEKFYLDVLRRNRK